MRESILHFIWQHQYFPIGVNTTDGNLVQVLQPGFHNSNAGPDFEQAKIKIGEVEWNGDVEIHVNSSDWSAHGHHYDEVYNKVILHVVWEDKGEVYRKDGTTLPTLELKNVVDNELLNRTRALLESIEPIPCSTQLNKVPEITIVEAIHRALIKRLERKAWIVLEELKANQGDWAEVAYKLLMRQMGMKVNGEAFYDLAISVPYKIVIKYKHSTEQLEALLFGASGLLDTTKEDDDYTERLRKEYAFLAHKHGLTKQLNPEQWKFMRLRPANFPTLRIAQVVGILANPTHIFEMFTAFDAIKDLVELLKVETSAYWKIHYRFGSEAKQKVPAIGKNSVELILLNVVAPLLAAYSMHISDNSYMEKAVSVMEALKPESNRIIKQWDQLGVRPRNGAESQGLIELYNEYCQHKTCLACGIGFKLLNYKV